MKLSKHWQVLAATLAVGLGACAEPPLGVPSAQPAFNVVGEPAFVLLKKHGAPGTYSFQITATTGSLPLGNLVSVVPEAWDQFWSATNAVQPVT